MGREKRGKTERRGETERAGVEREEGGAQRQRQRVCV